MRIIGGAWRGRRLAGPLGPGLRPSADRVRQALFDMLWHAAWGGAAVLEGIVVLDAFAGTGALGIEALSRWAARAVFFEPEQKARAVLAANIAACRAGSRSLVLAADAYRPPAGQECGLVFLDPPYGSADLPQALAALQVAGWIAPQALVVAETAAAGSLPDLGERLAERRHGLARLSIWRATSYTAGPIRRKARVGADQVPRRSGGARIARTKGR